MTSFTRPLDFTCASIYRYFVVGKTFKTKKEGKKTIIEAEQDLLAGNW